MSRRLLKKQKLRSSFEKSFLAFVFTTLFFSLNLLAAANYQARATLEPDAIEVGETSILRITIEGSSSASRPNIPDISGLDITFAGQSSQFQFINGHMSGGVTYTYGISPRKEGSFTIPPLNVGIGRTSIKTNPIQLNVSKSSVLQIPAPTPAPQTSVPPPFVANPPSPQTAPPVPKEAAWIELIYPKRDFYVGEVIPVDIRIYIRQGLQIVNNSLPRFSGTAFTFNKLGKPEEAQTTLGGLPFYVYTWHTAVSAVKTGDHPLGAEMELTILVTTQNRRRAPFGGGVFNDPWFDSFFGDVQQKRITLSSPGETMVKVASLPSEGKPSNFSGAIGRFQMSLSAEPTEVNAGDPITLKTNITGTGNFDRIHAPEIPKSNLYKIYPPSSKFDASDETGYSGQKAFEQIIVPKGSEVKEIPELHFSYFDPDTRKYVTLNSNQILVKVSGSSSSQQPEAGLVQQSTQNSLQTSSSKVGSTELVANKLEMGSLCHTLTPVLFSTWYWTLFCVPLIALGGAWGLAYRRKKLKEDPDFARSISASKAIRIHLSELDQSIKRGDAQAFFISGRRALQERLSESVGVKAETITLSEVENSLELEPVLRASLKKFFDMSDAVEYSGQSYTPEALIEWKKSLLSLLQLLEKRGRK